MLIAAAVQSGLFAFIGPTLFECFTFDSKDAELIDSMESPLIKERASILLSASEMDDLHDRETVIQIAFEKFAEMLNSLKEKPEKVFLSTIKVSEKQKEEILGVLVRFETEFITIPKAHKIMSFIKVLYDWTNHSRKKSMRNLTPSFNQSMGSGYSVDSTSRNFVMDYLAKHDGKMPPQIRKTWSTSIRLEKRFQLRFKLLH